MGTISNEKLEELRCALMELYNESGSQLEFMRWVIKIAMDGSSERDMLEWQVIFNGKYKKLCEELHNESSINSIRAAKELSDVCQQFIVMQKSILNDVWEDELC